MSSLKIVVTGASGFIGSKVTHYLVNEFPKSSIIGIGRRELPSRQSGYKNFKYISCDLLNKGIQNCIPNKFDILIHLAGDRRTFVKPDEFTLQFKSNVVMTNNMADFAYSSGAKLFLYASTVYVYSGNPTLPFRENSLEIPGDNLGATKFASEALLKARATVGQFKALSFRIGTVYGPGASHDQFIPQAIMKLHSPDPSAKFGAGDVKRDFIYIDDVALAFVYGIKRLWDRDFMYDALNVGTDISTSIRQVVNMLAHELGTKKMIEFDTFNNVGSKADTDHRLDLTRIRSTLGWHPRVSMKEGLHRTLKSYNNKG
jgi:nucleoside-diphosphate-sugar epimerase